jgi:cell wall-associated NlpC family hydrolase
VGQTKRSANDMREQKETFADICSEFIGKPYSENGIGPDSYSCVGFCYAFLKRTGKLTDESLWTRPDINVDNFMKLRNANPKETIELMLEIFSRMGKEIPVNKKIAGDLIIWEDINQRLHPGIYVGNQQFISSYRDGGVRVFVLTDKIKAVKIRRL